jgi:hypothetical protein
MLKFTGFTEFFHAKVVRPKTLLFPPGDFRNSSVLQNYIESKASVTSMGETWYSLLRAVKLMLIFLSSILSRSIIMVLERSLRKHDQTKDRSSRIALSRRIERFPRAGWLRVRAKESVLIYLRVLVVSAQLYYAFKVLA